MTQQFYIERRAHPRRKLRVKMELHVPDPAESTESQISTEPVKKCAFSRNISAGGILVLSTEPFPPGENLRVLIPFHDYNTTVAMAGEVIRCVEAELGHEMAVRFLDPDSNAVEIIEQYVLAE